MDIFPELAGIQMTSIQILLRNTFETPPRADQIAQEQLTLLFRQVQTSKTAKAQQLLAQRSQN
jgi:hypothetical protein